MADFVGGVGISWCVLVVLGVRRLQGVVGRLSVAKKRVKIKPKVKPATATADAKKVRKGGDKVLIRAGSGGGVKEGSKEAEKRAIIPLDICIEISTAVQAELSGMDFGADMEGVACPRVVEHDVLRWTHAGQFMMGRYWFQVGQRCHQDALTGKICGVAEIWANEERLGVSDGWEMEAEDFIKLTMSEFSMKYLVAPAVALVKFVKDWAKAQEGKKDEREECGRAAETA
jgi:hypothetical protein